MRINNIHILGFKSFMNKTNIRVSRGISAFVGPNGCGKSNIVDAIRWVMGEQSPRQLRGRRMEDIIFSSTGSQKSLGLAEVTLTLEHTNGNQEAREKSVTRRLYRSGESEYLMDNMPCRLKDIQDIFMGTGLGNRAYSIIAQGEISSLIEKKPEELRSLLEEAAGISKYKARREESLRKISLTKENLDRVEDLLSEINREMNSLKRQARKAKKFKEANSEIRHLELAMLASDYSELKKDKTDRERVIHELTNEERKSEELSSEAEGALEKQNLLLMDKEKQLTEMRDSLYSVKEERSNKESSLSHISSDLERLNLDSSKLKQEKDGILKRLCEYESEMENIDQRIQGLQGSAQEASELQEHYSCMLKDRSASLEDLKRGLNQEKARLMELNTREANLKGRKRNLFEMVNNTDTRKKGFEEEATDISKRTEDLSNRLNKKNEYRENLSQQLQPLEKEIQKKQSRLEELQELRTKRESEKNEAESNLNLLRSRVQTLKDLIQNYEGYKSGVQAIMNSKDLNPVKQGRVLGVIADFIQVKPEYEIATEAVLGERLQYMVVTKQDDCKDAVEYLKSKKKGRSYFLPLEEFKTELNKGHTNGFRLLKNYVSIPDKFRPVVESFLGNAAIVESLSEAISIWKKERTKQTLVTPQGDVVDERGIIIGGRDGKEGLGLLKRRREAKELTNNIKDREKLVSSLESEISNLVSSLDDLSDSMLRLETEKSSCLKKLDELDRDIRSLKSESEQLTRHKHYTLDQLESLTREKEEKSLQVKELEKSLSECLNEKKALERSLSKKEGSLNDLERDIAEVKEKYSGVLVQVNQFNEEKKGLLRERERLEQFMSEMDLRIKKIDRDIDSNVDQSRNCKEKEIEIKKRLEEIHKKQDAMQGGLRSLEAECERLKENLRQKEKNAGVIREKLRDTREKINQAKINKAETDFRLSNVISRANRELNIDLQNSYEEYRVDDFSKDEYEQRLNKFRKLKENIGEVNLLALNEYEKLKERCEFIQSQRDDLIKSIESLNNAIRRINRISRRRFLSTLKKVDEKLKTVFPVLFNGGTAHLKLIDENIPLETGVLLEAQPPGKSLVHMGLLSGGEKAMTAMAFLFAIYLIKPSPFIIMDEVDAPLDEANTDRFNDLLAEIRKSSQVIMVTHNRNTMEASERLYGVTMDKTGISKLVSVDLSDHKEQAAS